MPLTPESGAPEVVAAINDIQSQIGTLATKAEVAEVGAAVRDGLDAGPGFHATDVAGIGRFQNADGGVRLADALASHTVEINGESKTVSVRAPGLLTAGHCEDSGLDAGSRQVVTTYRAKLAEVNALRMGQFAGVPFQHLADLSNIAKGAPGPLRAALSEHAASVQKGFARFAEVRMRGQFSATPLSTAATSGNPGYQWVADTILPDVLDTTYTPAGLTGLLERIGGGDAGLHATAATKVRILTGLGGFAKAGRYNAAGSPAFTESSVATDVLSITGDRGVWAVPFDDQDLNDPRVVINNVAIMQEASRKAGLVLDDMAFLHGEKESAAADHVYGAAGLALITADGRFADFAGQDYDPLLIEDGLIAAANDASATLNGVSGTSLSAAADAFSSTANFLVLHKAAMGTLDDEFQYELGTAIVASKRVVAAIGALRFDDGTPVLMRATAAERIANPWLIGMLYDGTPVYQHTYMTSLWTSAGVIGTGGSLDAMFYAHVPSYVMVTGGGDDRFYTEHIPGTDKVLAIRKRNRALWRVRPAADKSVALIFNISAA